MSFYKVKTDYGNGLLGEFLAWLTVKIKTNPDVSDVNFFYQTNPRTAKSTNEVPDYFFYYKSTIEKSVFIENRETKCLFYYKTELPIFGFIIKPKMLVSVLQKTENTSLDSI